LHGSGRLGVRAYVEEVEEEEEEEEEKDDDDNAKAAPAVALDLVS
jgi:hypothetical protein